MNCSMPVFHLSLSPRVCSDSCLVNWWCYLTISSFAALFSFCLQSFPSSEFFPMSLLFASGGWSIGAIASIQFSRSVVSDSLRPHTLQHARPPCSLPNSRILLKFMSIELVMPSNHLICHPLLLLPSNFPSIRIFSSESILCIRWPKYWHFSLSISPANEYSGLISFSMDWLDLLVVQGTLKNLLQHHSSKASILWCSAFFTVHLSHPYMTIAKTIALTRQTFVGKVMSLLFNMLFRLVITFLLGSKRFLI